MSAKKRTKPSKLSKSSSARKPARSTGAKSSKPRRPTKASKPTKLAKPKRIEKAKKAKPPKSAKSASARRVRTKPAKRDQGVVRRRDSAGNIDPHYAAELLAQSGIRQGSSDSDAFLASSRSNDPLAEELGEEFVETVTSGEDEGQNARNEQFTEERGGPFVVTPSGTEFADGIDASNPKGSTREPFPRS